MRRWYRRLLDSRQPRVSEAWGQGGWTFSDVNVEPGESVQFGEARSADGAILLKVWAEGPDFHVRVEAGDTVVTARARHAESDINQLAELPFPPWEHILPEYHPTGLAAEDES